jgi:hypothetical protein
MYGMAEIYLRYLQRTNNNLFEITESLKDIVREVRELFHHTVGLNHTLSLRNRVMIVVLWLRS